MGGEQFGGEKTKAMWHVSDPAVAARAETGTRLM
jgi:hypothetical protein